MPMERAKAHFTILACLMIQHRCFSRT